MGEIRFLRVQQRSIAISRQLAIGSGSRVAVRSVGVAVPSRSLSGGKVDVVPLAMPALSPTMERGNLPAGSWRKKVRYPYTHAPP